VACVTYGPLLTPAEATLLTVAERRTLWQRVLGAPVPREAAIVAEEAGRVIGLVLTRATHDLDGDASTGEIGAIHVEPGRHGQGIGGALLTAGVAHLREAGFRRATLWVLRGNAEARRFYEGQGWRLDGATKRGPMADVAELPVVDEVRYRRTIDQRR
jgi:ribosomal protein S18 acetylase RimI-like enzyme